MSDSQVLENPARRQFIGSLFNREDPAYTAFERLDSNPFPSQGVIWAAETTPNNGVLFAGDDGIIFRYEKEAWHHEPVDTDLPIHSLCQAGDETTYGVGWLGLICERREGTWSLIQGGKRTIAGDSPDTVRSNLPLFDVTQCSSGVIWAVGDQGRIVCRKGQSWHEVDSGVYANLRCVISLNDGAIMASGAGGVVLRYVNQEWQRIETYTQCPIVSMVSVDINNVYAVGGEYSPEVGDFLGRVFHYDGKIWHEIDTHQPLPRLRRIRKIQDTIYITGDGGTAIRLTESEPTLLKTKVRYDLHDIIVDDSGEILVCGDGGSVLIESKQANSKSVNEDRPNFRAEPQWEIVAEELTKKTLRGIWAASSSLAFAVGDSGTILKFDGSIWSLEDCPLNIRLYAIWGTSENNVYAIGEKSTILHFDGNAWSACYRGEVDSALLAITGFGPHDIYVVGDNGIALRFNGLHWQRIETGTQYELYGLWGHDSNHLLAVGGAGLLIRWNGDEWQKFNVGTDDDIFGVWGRALDNIYFCGLSNTIIHFNGQAWERVNAGVRFDIHAITGSRSGRMFAAGSQGVILQFKDGDWEPEPSITDATIRALTITDDSILAVGSDGCILQKCI